MNSHHAAAQPDKEPAAFLKTESGITKAYHDGSDWLVQGPDGKIRYSSIWQADFVGSLKRALRTMVESVGDTFAENEIVYPDLDV